MLKLSYGIAAAALALIAAPANSTVYTFTVTGTDTASWSIDTATDTFVTAHVGGTPGFTYDHYTGVPVTVNGSSCTCNFDFFDSASLGGFQVSVPLHSYLALDGPILYSGTLASPTFLTGSFHFTEDFIRGAVDDTLVISDGSQQPLPEPATWAMMFLGFAGVGFALRRQKNVRLNFKPRAA